jgi:hypothetical protein
VTYSQFVDSINADDSILPLWSTQLTFLFYLLLGQVVLLLLWVVLRRVWPSRSPGQEPAAPSRWRAVPFAVYMLLGQVALLFGWPRLVELWLNAGKITRADLISTVHFIFVYGVLLSLALILVGGPLRWQWTRNFWFRLLHIIAIEIVAAQGIVQLECPLTTVDREMRGGSEYDTSASSQLGRFCNSLVYFHTYTWLLRLAYVVLGALVLFTWVMLPPRQPGEHEPPVTRWQGDKVKG